MSIQEYMIKTKKTLALAESCTGGRMAAELTREPGASLYFLGSLVVYSNELKSSLLQVPSKLIEEKGAVSEEVVEAMLSGLFRITRADYGIAVTGIAGPTGASAGKPVGTVYAAFGERGKAPRLHSLFIKGEREEMMSQTATHLLELFYAFLKNPI
ncbi:MAG: CinA family protein [Chlamydiales bacterium]|nr:CinA family protein [Chlamydiales bacterium]